jgi:hypothetical protein
MAKRKTQQQEAMEAGERNVVPGQSFLAALIRGIGREMQGSQGTPFGEATREELGSLGYEQMLREQFPEEFARGRLYGSEMFPTDIASMYAMRPGRSSFAPAMMAAEERAAPMGRLSYTPVAEAPKGSFDANMMAAFRRGEVGSRPAGRPQAFRPDDFLAIEQGPFAQSPNAFEGNMVMAQRRGMPSPSPANYDYQGPAVPGPMTDRPVSGFETNMLDWARGGRTPPGRTGAFREGDFAPYSPEEMGQGVALRGETMPMSQRGGLPMMVEERGIPYAEYRDVTGNVLAGPAREAPYGGGMDFGVTREGQAMRGGVPYGKIAAGAAGVGIPMMAAYYNSGREPTGARPVPQGIMEAPRGSAQLPPIDIYGQRIPMAGMEAAPVAQKAAPAAKAPKGGKKAMPTPPKKPAEMSKEQAAEFEGNLNYYVTQMLDRLTGQNEAERGRMTQQYYERNPY